MKTLNTLAAAASVSLTALAAPFAPASAQIPEINIPNPLGDITGRIPKIIPPYPNPQAPPVLKPTLKTNTSEQAAYNKASKNYSNTVIQGALIGGAAGAALCSVLGETNDTQTAICAAIGGAIGGMTADAIAKRNTELIKDRESVLKAIDNAKRSRAAASDLLAATERNCASLESQIADLKARQASGRISKQQLQVDLAEARNQQKMLADSVKKVSVDIADQKKIMDSLEQQAATSSNPDIKGTMTDLKAQSNAHGAFLSTETVRAERRVKELEKTLGST